MAFIYDWWKNASRSDWRDHVVQTIDMSSALIADWDHTFFEATKILSDAYVSLHGQRAVERPEPSDEHELEALFWDLQRSSIVIDSVVGSACVVLMRWMDQAKRIAIADFILLETKFPFETDPESEKDKWTRHDCLVMRDFGSKVPEKDVSGASAIWQIGNVFKHGGGGNLRKPTENVAKKLGFSSQMLEIPEHEDEEALRQMALKEVAYTLDADSIERMALQLGCGPIPGLMPLYDHVESWQKAIGERLRDKKAALYGLP
ncbi:MAG: hypothetical protein ABFD90_07175 [Phycisphaerales bacterium]